MQMLHHASDFLPDTVWILKGVFGVFGEFSHTSEFSAYRFTLVAIILWIAVLMFFTYCSVLFRLSGSTDGGAWTNQALWRVL